jgi:5'-nucleotidase
VIALDDIRGFVFDLDGTLIQRTRDGHEPIRGAVDVLSALRTSGRPFVVFTNASHVGPEVLAREVREGGLDVRATEVLTPVCVAISLLRRRYPGQPVLLFSTEATRARLADSGVALVDGADGEHAAVVLVAHPAEIDITALERAARALVGGARLLTASYVPAYAGADGPIFSRGAMVTAAIAKASGARPVVVGKPSRTAVREIVDRLGLPSRELAVVGDDVALEVVLGKLGGSRSRARAPAGAESARRCDRVGGGAVGRAVTRGQDLFGPYDAGRSTRTLPTAPCSTASCAAAISASGKRIAGSGVSAPARSASSIASTACRFASAGIV